MLKASYPYYLANQASYANTDLVVTNKFTGEPATRVAQADAKAIEQAIAAAADAAVPCPDKAISIRCSTSAPPARAKGAGSASGRQ